MKWSEMSERERDALMAEKVVGAEWVNLTPAGRKKELRMGGRPVAETHGAHLIVFGVQQDDLPRYTTDIAAAWEVVEKLDILVSPTMMRGVEGWTKWGAGVFRGIVGDDKRRVVRETWAEADTAPEAICLAALRAVGVEIEP